MLSVVSVVARYERAVLGNVARSMSTKVPLTPEEIKQNIVRGQKLKQFMLKPATTTLATGVGSGADLHVPQNIAEIAALSGMPAEHSNRTVLIGQRMLKSVQSGQSYAHQWQITWKNAERWLNPLMGWSSSADPMAQVKLHFDTKEDAIGFAERNGWAYEVLRETSKSNRPPGFTAYKDNFLDKRTVKQLKKEGMKNKIFVNPGYGKSQFFMPLKYHGDGEVAQHGPTVRN